MRENTNTVPAIQYRHTKNKPGEYPVIPIPDTLDFLRKVHQYFPGNTPFTQQAIDAAFADRMTIAQDTAAGIHYGLLKRMKGYYHVTRLLKNVMDPPPV